MNKQDIKKAIQDLNNDIYYEKLGNMVSDLRRWFNDKDKLINQCYVVSSEEIFNKSNQIQEQIENQTGQLALLLDEINTFFGFVSKEGFLNKKNGSSKKKTKSQSYTQAIQQVRQVWSKRQANIIQILNIYETINILISKQNGENRKILNQMKIYGKKIKASPQNSLSQYIKKFQISVTKKNQKQFQLNKIKQVYQLFQTESADYQKNMDKILNLQGKLIDGQAWFIESFKADVNNLVFVLNQCFVGFKDTITKYIQQLMISFKLKIKQIQQSLLSLQNFRLTSTIQLKQRLNLIKRQSIQQIQIASWTIYYSLQEKQSNFVQKKGIITFDNKFLIVQQASSTVQLQINLSQAFLQPVKQLGKLMLKFKGKKKNEIGKIHIKFLREENEDQFRLHIQKAKGQIQ